MGCASATAAARSINTATKSAASALRPSAATMAKPAGDNSQRAATLLPALPARPTSTRAPPAGASPAATVTKGRTITPPALMAAGPSVKLSSRRPRSLMTSAAVSVSMPGTAKALQVRLTAWVAGAKPSVKAPRLTLRVPALCVTLMSAGTKASSAFASVCRPKVTIGVAALRRLSTGFTAQACRAAPLKAAGAPLRNCKASPSAATRGPTGAGRSAKRSSR